MHPSAQLGAAEYKAATALSLLDEGDDEALRDIAKALAVDGAVALRLGVESSLYPKAREEALRAIAHARPVVQPSSGSPRGDTVVRLSQLQTLGSGGGGRGGGVSGDGGSHGSADRAAPLTCGDTRGGRGL